MDQLAVVKAVNPCRSFDTGNPQRSEIPFFNTPVAKCVVQGAVYRLSSASEQLAPGAAVTFGQFQHLVSSLSRFKSSSYSRHQLLLCVVFAGSVRGDGSSRFTDFKGVKGE